MSRRPAAITQADVARSLDKPLTGNTTTTGEYISPRSGFCWSSAVR